MLNSILQLERPLAVLDLESTGVNVDQDRIVQIAITIHYPHRDPIAWTTLINPERPIPNSHVHGVKDDDVVDHPRFVQVAPALAPKLLKADIAGYNVTFDVNLLRAEMRRANVEWNWEGHMIDAYQIFRMKVGHTLTNAYKRFVDPAGFPDAHDAGKDVAATEKVLHAQLREFTDLPRTVKALSEVCFPKPQDAVDGSGKFVWREGSVVCNFGKHKGVKLENMPRAYLTWMFETGDFRDDVKTLVQNALQGGYPTKGN